jgi:hypothetical protein
MLTVWRHFGRSVGKLDGRSANQAANRTGRRRIGRWGSESGGELNDWATSLTVGQRIRRRIGRLGGVLDGIAKMSRIKSMNDFRRRSSKLLGRSTKRFDCKSSFSIANCIAALKVERFLANSFLIVLLLLGRQSLC